MSDSHAGHNHDHGSHADEGIDSVVAFKYAMLVVMVLCCGLGLIPKGCGACSNSTNTLSLLNCFSAGIFLTMALVHMMPEGAELYDIWAAKNEIERPFPVPYFAFFFGYMLVLGIDRVAAAQFHKGHDHEPRGDVAIDDMKPEEVVRKVNELREGGENELQNTNATTNAKSVVDKKE